MTDVFKARTLRWLTLSVMLMIGGAQQDVLGGEESYLKHGLELINSTGSLVDVIDITDGQSMSFTFYLNDPLPLGLENIVLKEVSPDSFGHISFSPSKWQVDSTDFAKTDDGRWAGTFNLTGTFLGFTEIMFLLEDNQGEALAATKSIDVKVQRSDQLWDTIFTVCIVGLVAVAYVNMGCALDLDVIVQVLKKPVAPLIGVSSQYLLMPLTSYALGFGLFYDSPAQWLGLFLIGSCPGGGGSNIWTYLLGGSLDLSVTMTLVSTIVAFAALPLWVYALATSIFRDGDFERLPFSNIAGMVAGLILPCAIGILIQKYKPSVAQFLKKMLTPVAVIFIVFVSTVGIYVNLYIFSYMTWQVALAGFCLPTLGFTFGGIAGIITRRTWQEIVAISVETGIQNTGLAIGVVKVAMKKFSPLGDITVIVPIAVSMMTPIPLITALVIKKIYECRHKKKGAEGIDGPMQEEGAIQNSHKMTPATPSTPLQKNFK